MELVKVLGTDWVSDFGVCCSMLMPNLSGRAMVLQLNVLLDLCWFQFRLYIFLDIAFYYHLKEKEDNKVDSILVWVDS